MFFLSWLTALGSAMVSVCFNTETLSPGDVGVVVLLFFVVVMLLFCFCCCNVVVVVMLLLL